MPAAWPVQVRELQSQVRARREEVEATLALARSKEEEQAALWAQVREEGKARCAAPHYGPCLAAFLCFL